MKTIIAGSRSINDIEIIRSAVKISGFNITEVVSGTARGVDRLGEVYADKEDIVIKRFPADWDRYGRGAGYRRNAQMAEYGDALIAIWDGESRGTASMIRLARGKGLRVYVHVVKQMSVDNDSDMFI